MSWVAELIILLIAGLILAYLTNGGFRRKCNRFVKNRIINFVKIGLVKVRKKPWLWIPLVIILTLTIVLHIFFRDFFYPKIRLTVAVSHFYQVTKSEGESEYEKSLIYNIENRLRRYKDIMTYSIYSSVKDSSEADKLGSEKKVNIVLWGTIEKIGDEIECTPYISIIKPFGKASLKADNRGIESKSMCLGETGKLDFVRREAREIGDAIAFICGFAEYELKEYEKAIKIFDQLTPQIPEAFFYIGTSYLLLSPAKYKEAQEYYQESVRKCSTDVAAYNNWGYILNVLEKYDEATDKFQKGIGTDPNCQTLYYNYGLTLGNQGKYEEAIKKFEKTVELDSSFAQAYVQWGITLKKLQKLEPAMEKFQKAIELEPKYYKAHLGVAGILLERKKYEQVIDLCSKLTSLGPNRSETSYLWGMALDGQRRYKEAIGKYRKTIQLDSTFYQAYFELAEDLGKLKNYDEAVQNYDKGMEVYTTNSSILEGRRREIELIFNAPKTYVDWAVLLSKANKPKEALAKLDTAIALNPHNGLAHVHYANILVAQGKCVPAIIKCAKAVQLDSTLADAYFVCALAFSCLGDKENEIAMYQKTVATDSNFARAYFNWGVASQEAAEWRDAIKLYKKTIEKDSNLAEAHFNLAMLLCNTGQKSEGIKEFQVSLELFKKQKNNEGIERTRNKLKIVREQY